MADELVVLGQQDLQRGGLGFSSRIFQNVKPSVVDIIQPMTRMEEGKVIGKLRDTSTSQLYDAMQVVLLREPTETRAYFEGTEFTKESKICFSQDNLKPSEYAKIPQAMACGYYAKNGRYVPQCPHASWEKYRQTKDRNDIPKCREQFNMLVADRLTQLPYYINIKGKSIEPFMKAMEQLAKLVMLMKSKGKNPNICDVSFTVYPVSHEKGTYYTFGFKDIAPLAEEDRAAFGELFLEYYNRKALAVEDEVEDTDATIDAQVSEASSDAIEGEIVI